MHSAKMLRFFPAICLFFICSCQTAKKITTVPAGISSIKLIGQYEIPFAARFKNTAIGGLSGIDYDAKNNRYFFICDDRSDKNPARFYTARIYLKQTGIDSVVFTDMQFMLQPDGSVYPNNKQNKFLTPDPEAIRYNPVNNTLAWTSEGERILGPQDTVLENPSIIFMQPNGKFIDSIPLPENLRMQATEKGPRRNSVLEGMSFTNNYQSLFVSVEEPLYEDGPQAELTENNAFIRIYRFDVNTRKNTGQYAYKLSPVAYPPDQPTAFKINGVPDILDIGNNKLLVIERSFSTGRLACTIKLFVADLEGATDISNTVLKNKTDFVPVSRKLLLNMDDLGMYTDNIEGVTFGPVLPNGHKTLLFIADNNFNPVEKAQLLLFEVLE